MNTYIKKFSEIGIEDISTVGGKNASLGEMYSKLSSKGIAVPDGFAYTVSAFKSFLTINQLDIPIKKLMLQLDKVNYSNLKEYPVYNQNRLSFNNCIANMKDDQIKKIRIT